jgi:deazaflavin-dependent oxidoreductase (nitroreductase family)
VSEADGTRRPNPVWRWWLRAPLALYRIRIGRFALGELALWLYGHPHVRIAHRGRRTGQLRQVVLEVLEVDATAGEFYVSTMWGPGSDWYRNLQAAPAIEVELRGERLTPSHRFLSSQEGDAVLNRYRRRHRVWAAILRRMIGRPITAVSMPVVAFRYTMRS